MWMCGCACGDRWRCALDTRDAPSAEARRRVPVGACGQQTGVLGREELICNYPGTTEREKKTICHNLTLAGAAASINNQR